MALTPGTTLGPYEILSPIGAGGMGEVYTLIVIRTPPLIQSRPMSYGITSKPKAKSQSQPI